MTGAVDFGYAASLIEAIEPAAREITVALEAEHATRAARDAEREAIVNALLGNLNPMTNKPHSATSAGAAADADPTILALEQTKRAAESERIMAWARYESTRLRAKLAVRAVEG